jgi:transcriptional regulator with XRE-family HTH domain
VSLMIPLARTAEAVPDSETHPAARTGGRLSASERQQRLDIWANFINAELTARNMRPAQLAAYANVNASTVSVWRHRKSLPDRAAVVAVARCLRLPVELVAEKAGMIVSESGGLSRLENDSEWRALLSDIERMPDEQFRAIKSALRNALTSSRRRAS